MTASRTSRFLSRDVVGRREYGRRCIGGPAVGSPSRGRGETAYAATGPGDYYAGALALFGIILFAKFVTHQRKALSRVTVWHFVCVFCAWAGAALALGVLGWDELLGWGDADSEVWMPRTFV